MIIFDIPLIVKIRIRITAQWGVGKEAKVPSTICGFPCDILAVLGHSFFSLDFYFDKTRIPVSADNGNIALGSSST
jgi:hypothetical protein